jgi:hypothetical protein
MRDFAVPQGCKKRVENKGAMMPWCGEALPGPQEHFPD